MPLLGLAEQRLHPHRPFPHRFRVGGCAMVLPHPLAVRLVERAIELPAFAAVGTPRPDRAGLTGIGRRLVDADLGDVVVAPQAQHWSYPVFVDRSWLEHAR